MPVLGDNSLPSCSQCRINGTECVRLSATRFHNRSGPSTRPDVAFPHEQTWLTPLENCKSSHSTFTFQDSEEGKVQYYDETPEIVKLYADAEFERTAPPGSLINSQPLYASQVLWQSAPQHNPNLQDHAGEYHLSGTALPNVEASPSQSFSSSFTLQTSPYSVHNGMSLPATYC